MTRSTYATHRLIIALLCAALLTVSASLYGQRRENMRLRTEVRSIQVSKPQIENAALAPVLRMLHESHRVVAFDGPLPTPEGVANLVDITMRADMKRYQAEIKRLQRDNAALAAHIVLPGKSPSHGKSADFFNEARDLYNHGVDLYNHGIELYNHDLRVEEESDRLRNENEQLKARIVELEKTKK